MEVILRDKFLENKMVTSRNQSSNSYKSYLSGINGFYNFIISLKGIEFETDMDLLMSVTSDDYEKYFYKLVRENAKSTTNSRLNATKQLFSYVIDRDEGIEKDPTKLAKAFSSTVVKQETKKKDTLTIEEIKKILNNSYIRIKYEKNFDENSARDRCLLAILATGGLRISEALNIKIKDIEETPYGKIIKIYKTKNRVDKRTPITKGIEVYFREHLSARLIDGAKSEDYLFLNKYNEKMGYTGSENLLNKAIQKAGIEKEITTHSFRHTLTQILIERNINESMIYKIIGWEEDSKTIGSYSGEAADPRYDEIKFKHCNILS